jgi:hypothetical protein
MFALTTPTHAQPAPSVTAVMTASATSVPVGGTFRLEINIDATGGDAPDPELPDLSAFEVLSRQVFRPTSIRMGWGTSSTVVTSSVRITFVLRATREGAVSITPARARVGGREFRSNPLTIAVTAAGTAPTVGPPGAPPGAPPGTPPAANPGPPTGVLDGAVYDDQVFVRTVVDRAEAYVGEQVTCTVYVYVRSRVMPEPPLTREPSTDGFWTFNLRARDQPAQQTVQVIGGMAFQVYAVRRFAAFPIAAGEVTIGAPTTVISRASPIDIFMGTPQPDIERTGVPITIRVRELPEGRPAATRTTHTGTLNLEATLDRTQVPTGDAVTLTLTASGTGQIDALNFGDLALDGVRVLSPQTDGEVAASADRVGGTRRIQWLLVPEREGSFVIPAFRVAVFDPRTASWSVAETAPLTLMAAGNPMGGAIASPDEAPESDDEIVPIELGPVRTTSALRRRNPRIANTTWFPWTAAAMPLALGLFVLGRNLRARRGRAGASGPQRGAKEARKRLDAAAAAASSGDARAFYAAVILALKSVVEGKLGESVGSLTHPQLKQRLVDRGMSEPLAKSVVDELESSEYARFSTSGGEPKEMQACLARARNVLGELERFSPSSEDDA